MSYDRDAALDALAEQEDERRMDEYYDQQYKEHYECMRQMEEELERAEDEESKPQYQKEDDYYAAEAKLDEQAELEYKDQLKKYYDELEVHDVVDSEDNDLESIVNDYYKQIDEEKES